MSAKEKLDKLIEAWKQAENGDLSGLIEIGEPKDVRLVLEALQKDACEAERECLVNTQCPSYGCGDCPLDVLENTRVALERLK